MIEIFQFITILRTKLGCQKIVRDQVWSLLFYLSFTLNCLFVLSDMATASSNEIKKCFGRRDRLREIESKVKKWWEEEDVFKSEPCENPPKPGEKFFGNFPFPYTNGYLHLGHAFSLSKLEFAAAFHRLRGANVLLPFAFHGRRGCWRR